METSVIIVLAVNVGLGLLGYLMRDKMKKIEADLLKTQLDLRHVEIHYAQKTDMESMKTEILGRFDRLEDKLDRLQ